MGKRKGRSGIRRTLRTAYRVLGSINTATYILGAGSAPGALVKHLLRRHAIKIGGRILR